MRVCRLRGLRCPSLMYSYIIRQSLHNYADTIAVISLYIQSYHNDAALEYMMKLWMTRAVFEIVVISRCPDSSAVARMGYLLENGANVHYDNSRFLCVATLNGNVDIVRVLVRCGADVHVHDNEPLKIAVRNGYTSVFEVLVNAGAIVTFNVICQGTPLTYDMTVSILDAGVDINYNNGYLLRMAELYDEPKIVKMLLERGACYNIK